MATIILSLRTAKLITALVLACAIAICGNASAAPNVTQPKFAISFAASVHQQPATGRLFLMISRTNEPEVRLQSYWWDSPQFTSINVDGWRPGQITTVDEHAVAYPLRTLGELPPGDYYVQAYLQCYVEYHRADGHVIWALDQWTGHSLGQSPGDLYSDVQKVHLSDARGGTIALDLSKTVPQRPPTPDTEWVKYIKIKSELLSHFWGRPIYLGAIVLLPQGYSAHPKVEYPVIYHQQIVFSDDELLPPFGFAEKAAPESDAERHQRERNGYETGYQFHQAWSAEDFPRVLAVKLLHPTPYADLSSMANSVNNGPYRDAIMQELIPYLETHYRIIRKPSARILVGKNVGARDALTLQLHHPEFFGGAWLFYSWPFDFHRYFAGINIYDHKNAFKVDPQQVPSEYQGQWWQSPERVIGRTLEGQPFMTMREMNSHDVLMADKWPGGELGYDEVAFGPIAENGYPKPLFNKKTGEIDGNVANAWREHGDLAEYVRRNWTVIGAQLAGKLHFYIGDSDDYLRNYSVYRFQDFLNAAPGGNQATFQYGFRKGKDWQPMTNEQLVRIIAREMRTETPRPSPPR